MEPVKTCATCRHSIVGRRDPMDWWKRRLCAHPGLVDRVEGRPLYEAVEARGKDGFCGATGTLWEGVPVTVRPPKGEWNPELFAPGRIVDPVDAAVEAAHRTTVEHDLPQSFNHQATMTGERMKLERDERVDSYGMPAPVDGVPSKVTNADEAFTHVEVKKTFTVDPGMLPRKPAKRARRRGDA